MLPSTPAEEVSKGGGRLCYSCQEHSLTAYQTQEVRENTLQAEPACKMLKTKCLKGLDAPTGVQVTSTSLCQVCHTGSQHASCEQPLVHVHSLLSSTSHLLNQHVDCCCKVGQWIK